MVDINSFINYVESNHPFLGKIYFFKGAILYEKRDYFRSLEYLNYAIKKSPDLFKHICCVVTFLDCTMIWIKLSLI